MLFAMAGISLVRLSFILVQADRPIKQRRRERRAGVKGLEQVFGPYHSNAIVRIARERVTRDSSLCRMTRRKEMRNPFAKIAAGFVLGLAAMTPAAGAQAAPGGSVVVASPTYTSVAMEITVNRPAAEVWKRIGKYCDVGEWLQVPAGCKIVSGKDGEFGAVRSVGGEVLVGRTEL